MPTDQTASIIAWMRQQRWFGDKSRILDSFVFGTFGSVDGNDAPIELLTIDCGFRDGQRSSYFIPLVGEWPAGTHDPDVVVDAFDTVGFLDWLADGFGARRSLTHHGRTMSWVPGPVAIAAGDGRLLHSDQSNTSIQYGDHAIAKVFRRLQPGVNPDVEVIQYLTEQTAFRQIPRHLGTVTVTTGTPGQVVTLVAVQEYVRNEGDGWTWLLRELERHSPAHDYDALEGIELLGKRTAELHLALASPTKDRVFAPERILEGEIDALQVRLRVELDRTMAGVLEAGARSQAVIDELGTNVKSKLILAQSLAGSLKTRVHGDYHLGQVLRTDDDFVIIDFEGEPSRPLAVRREKVSPLKDVAGMLRSLDYAVASRERTEPKAGSPRIREWGEQARVAFLAGYRTPLQMRESSIFPRDDRAFFAALDLFLIEKALYEIRYELDNRPHWLEIPLKAIESLTVRPVSD